MNKKKITEFIKYIFFFQPYSERANMFSNFFRWLILTTSTAIVGLVVVAVFFNFISGCFPKIYRPLTKWANQPPIPLTKSCRFAPLLDVDNSQSSASKFLKWYDVHFTLDTSTGSTSLAVAYVDDMHFAPYFHGHRAKPKASDPSQLFIPKTNFKNSEFKLTVVHDSEDGELGQLDFNYNECPIKLEFFGGDK